MTKAYTFLENKDIKQMELFGDACRLLGADGISIFTNTSTMEEGEDAFQWIRDALGEELWAITWVAVIPCPSFAQFVLELPQLNKALLTTGVSQSPAHKTSLFRRILIPMDAIVDLPVWEKPDQSTVPTGDAEAIKATMLEDVPAVPLSQLGLPRKKPAPVAKPAAQDIDLDALDLTSDEKAFAEQMLSGVGLQVAANKVGMSWQAVVQKLKPGIVAKFKAAGKDFEAACSAAKLKQGEAALA